MKKTTWPGNWKATCHVCGMWFPSSEIKKRWDGLLVCHKDFESRHPQTLIKITGEKSFPTFVSKDKNPDDYVLVCGVDGSSAYADLAKADCARVDNTSVAYQTILDIFGNGHVNPVYSASLYADAYADAYA